MSAYAALVSVLQLLETILDSGGYRIKHIRAQLRSLHEKVTLVLYFLESSSACKGSQTSELETRIRVAAYKAEDHLEWQMFQTLHFRRFYNIMSMLVCVMFAYILVSSVTVSYPYLKPVLAVAAVMTAAAASAHLAIPNLMFDPSTKIEIVLLHQVLQGFSIIEEELTNINEVGGDGEMSAHAALVSLRRILDSILGSGGQRISRSRAHLECLHEKLSFLLDFLGNASAYMRTEKLARQNLDARIRRAAYEAKKALMRFLVPRRFGVGMPKLPRFLIHAIYITLILINNNYQLIPLSFPVWIQVIGRTFLMLPMALQILILEFIVGFVNSVVWPAIRNYGGPEIEGLPQLIGDLSIIVTKAMEMKDASGNPSDLPTTSSSSSRRELGYTGQNVVVGLESDIKQIKARLVQDSSRLGVISIVGMGGIGKTTLARKVYDDPDILCRFDVRVWVTISQQYSLRHVLLGLLDSAKILTEEKRKDDDDKLALYLHQYLMYRRYLIVIDDVWDTDIWDFLSRLFPENDNGSRILITSRLSGVASYADSDSPFHHMKYLNDNDSWVLLRTKVFGEEGCPLELESIGKEIAMSCRGLPLAIAVIGGLLYKDKRSKIWREVAENLSVQWGKIEEQCLEILGLSYNHMPHHLRPCFLYMGVFLGDSEIVVSRLISLWAAEGFLKPSSSKSLEEVAEDYLKDLIDRNLILVCKRSCNGKIRTCSIHDLLRVVCVQNALKENFFLVMEGDERPEQTPRRLSIRPDALQANFRHDLISSYHYVRSFLCTSSKLLDNQSSLYLGFLYLRVLDVLVVHFGEFPDQIIKLLHLRYLAFHYDGLLPPSMSKLNNLQTIVHHHCSLNKYLLLPSVIWSMPNLRHLYVKPGCYLFTPFFYRLPGSLPFRQHLQTLVGIRNVEWIKANIESIPNLKKLVILYDVSSSVDWSTYQLESLDDLLQLESLKIIIKYNDVGSTIPHEPPRIEFPLKLKKLSLSGCGIPWASIFAVPYLEALKLRREACSGPSWETVEGEFPRLMFLLLEEIGFTRWETDEAHFPRLQRLVIRSCGMLEEIPSAIGDIPTLEMIELVDCLPSAVDSAYQIQEEQISMGNEELKVCVTQSSHIP